jgi:hypothetical protein
VSPTVRNVLIIVAAAAVLFALGSLGSSAASLMLAILSLLILAGLLYFGYTLYRDNRSQLQWVPRNHKIALYAAGAVIVLTLLTSWFWATTLATSLLMFLLLGGSAYVIYRVWQESRRYY